MKISVVGPYSIKRPEGWDQVAAFSRGRAKPLRQAAQQTLDELLENIKLENCVYYPDVVNAILRRVPGSVEAENYGHDGAGKSYSVKDASVRSEYYRTSEPVPVVIADGLKGESQVTLETAGESVRHVFLAGAGYMADAAIVLSHVTGHMVAGLGGSIKNVAMGFAGRAGPRTPCRSSAAQRPGRWRDRSG